MIPSYEYNEFLWKLHCAYDISLVKKEEIYKHQQFIFTCSRKLSRFYPNQNCNHSFSLQLLISDSQNTTISFINTPNLIKIAINYLLYPHVQCHFHSYFLLIKIHLFFLLKRLPFHKKLKKCIECCLCYCFIKFTLTSIKLLITIGRIDSGNFNMLKSVMQTNAVRASSLLFLSMNKYVVKDTKVTF